MAGQFEVLYSAQISRDSFAAHVRRNSRGLVGFARLLLDFGHFCHASTSADARFVGPLEIDSSELGLPVCADFLLPNPIDGFVSRDWIAAN